MVLPATSRDNIPGLYSSGLKMTEIAARLGVSVSAVSALLKRRGVRVRHAAHVVPVGKVFSRLTVLGRSRTKRYWLCRCVCGTECEVACASILRGLTRSCGCLRRETNKRRETVIPIKVGDIFDRLTVIAATDRRHHWACRCMCGRVTVVWKYSLTSGGTGSCGCKSRERTTTHGLSGSTEHQAWRSMIQRCTNPKAPEYRRYGGRGIGVCPHWQSSFSDFLADVGRRPTRRHSLGRIDNSRGYELGNVAWQTRPEQNRNKRNTRLIEFQGEHLLAGEWEVRTGIPAETIRGRLRRGWPVERALTIEP